MQLQRLKSLVGNPSNEDDILQFYLDSASDIICDIRNSNIVERQYLTTQIKMAIEMYNRRGVEGQTSHTENGIGRTYERADVSYSLIKDIIPVARTPYSKVRVIM